MQRDIRSGELVGMGDVIYTFYKKGVGKNLSLEEDAAIPLIKFYFFKRLSNMDQADERVKAATEIMRDE